MPSPNSLAPKRLLSRRDCIIQPSVGRRSRPTLGKLSMALYSEGVESIGPSHLRRRQHSRKRQIPQHPETKHHRQSAPQPPRPDLEMDSFPCDDPHRRAQHKPTQERQHNHKQRVEVKRGQDVTVKQLVRRPQRAASGTPQPGHPMEKADRINPRPARFEPVKHECSGRRKQR
jgi:hypothetical protein